MNSEEWDIVIIGGGLAGIEAALALQNYRLKVLLLDENPNLGGQYLRGSHRQFYRGERLYRKGHESINRLKAATTTIFNGCEVLGLSANRQAIFRHPTRGMLEACSKTVLLACGARERFLPFPGWTLPGVVSTGALQLLIKSANRLPAERITVAGAGAFPWILAGQVLVMKGTLQALIEQGNWFDKSGLGLAMTRLPYKWTGALTALTRVLKSRAPIHAPAKVIEARGRDRIEEVVFARVDAKGRQLSGTEQTLPCGFLAIAQGFESNLELARLAGCALEYDPDRGGWVVGVSPQLETSIPGIFAAGELTGIAGAGKSFLEGRLAGLSVLKKLSVIAPKHYEQKARSLLAARVKELAFGRAFNRNCRISDEAINAIPDETIVCRCEDVTAGQIREAARFGSITVNSAKRATRAGMGICQGRTCGSILQDILRLITGGKPEELGPLSVRIPVKAIRLEELAVPLQTIE